MKQTPLRQMIVFTEMQISELKAIEHTNIHAPAILTLLNQQLNALQSLLPVEREAIEVAYKEGGAGFHYCAETSQDYFTNTYKQ